MRVFKYPIPNDGYPAKISAPGAYKILHAGPDPTGQVCVWAAVMPDRPQMADNFARVLVAGTGHDIGEPFRAEHHIGSYVDGPFVWHVFAFIRNPNDRVGV